ncbi:MAG: hypothetical protein ACE5J7_01385 [Candidatus Aenigmatarchaeota archaeon]
MKKKRRETVIESFLMYFSSIVAVFLIISLAFSNFALPIGSSLNSVGLSSGLFIILALSMFLYIIVKVRNAKVGARK